MSPCDAAVSEWETMCGLLETLRNQKLGPSAPLPAGTPIRIQLACTQAYTQGKLANRNNSILGPNLREDASEAESLVLATYFSLGLESTSDNTSVNSPLPEGRKPDDYRGDKANYKPFVTQLALVFGGDPIKFQSDKAKINYAASYLRGPAFDWLQPFIDELTGDIIFSEYPDFLAGLKAGFADPDAYATAEHQLDELCQTSSCSAYYSQFVALMTQLQWKEDAVKIHHFRKGLKNAIKDMLVGRELPSEMKEFAELCIKLDNQLVARANEKKFEGKFKPSVAGPSSSSVPKIRFSPMQPEKPSTFVPSEDPMQLDAAAKQAYRKANNLCTYCGGEGHWVRNCEKAIARNKRVSAAQRDPALEFIPSSVVLSSKNSEI